jgi:hypothetical protein
MNLPVPIQYNLCTNYIELRSNFVSIVKSVLLCKILLYETECTSL